MAISKVTLNGVTQMDVTQKTVTANTMLNGITSLKNDGTDITGNIQTKTSSDLTVSGATVTAPAGHYQNAASKTIPNADPYVTFDAGSFVTEDGTREFHINPMVIVDVGEGDTPGYLGEGTITGNTLVFPAVPANTTITPSTSTQTVGGIRSMMEGALTVAAMPSGTAGTPTATKGTVNNHAISVTPSVTNTTGYITGSTKTGTAVTVSASELVSGTKSISANGTGIDVTNYASVNVAVPSGSPNLQAKTNIAPSTSSQTVTADSGYDGLSSVQINAMPSGSVTAPSSISGSSATISTGTNTLTFSKTVSVTPNVTTAGYISSGTAGNSNVSLTASINTRSSSDLTASGATVTAPAGYYGSAATKSVASGTAGTPTATKGTVSNHAISVTPSVTNTAGYIEGGTKTGTAVSVSASELVSGSETITSNGNFDVSTLASIIANFPDSWEAESGTFTPASDTITYEVAFSKTHEELPFYTLVVDVTNTYNTTTYTSAYMSYFNWQTLWGNPFYVSTNTRLYGVVNARYRNTSTTAVSISNWNIYYSQNTTDNSTNQYPRYWVTESGMHCEASASSYWRSNRTYNWIAVWRPTIKPSWEYGTINTSTGANGSAATNRLRTTTYIPVTSTTQVYLKSDTNVALLGYTSSNAFVENSLGWLTSSFNLATALADYPTITKVRLMAKKTDGSTITDVQTLAGNIVVKGLA